MFFKLMLLQNDNIAATRDVGFAYGLAAVNNESLTLAMRNFIWG
jgi:hypothetical protein